MVPLTVAAAQSPTTADAAQNGWQIGALMVEAKAAGAHLVHFPEAALSGYCKAQIEDWKTVDWSAIPRKLGKICMLACDLDLWVVLGCNHRLTAPNRPHNSLYVISFAGEIVTRYDKRFCSHSEITDCYSPDTQPVVFEVNGVHFGCALCIEVQFPELFAENAQMGVHCMLRQPMPRTRCSPCWRKPMPPPIISGCRWPPRPNVPLLCPAALSARTAMFEPLRRRRPNRASSWATSIFMIRAM